MQKTVIICLFYDIFCNLLPKLDLNTPLWCFPFIFISKTSTWILSLFIPYNLIVLLLHFPRPLSSNFISVFHGSTHDSNSYSPASHQRGLCWIPGQSMWDLWWAKWHSDWFFSSCLVVPCQHHCTTDLNSFIHLSLTLHTHNNSIHHSITHLETEVFLCFYSVNSGTT